MKKQQQFTLALLLIFASLCMAGCSKAYEFHGTVNDPPTSPLRGGQTWMDTRFNSRSCKANWSSLFLAILIVQTFAH